VSTQPKSWILITLCCAAGIAAAQQAAPPVAPAPTPAAKSTPQAEAGEPRADTSGRSAPVAAPALATPAAGSAPAAGAANAGRAEPTARPAASGVSTARPSPGVPAAAQKSPTKADRLDLGTATVTGDREQPKVMYIVPWKRSDIGDLAGKPMNSLVDEILAPVDRDVFKREVVYYQAVQADASQNGAQPKAAPQGEK
jgi:hypothetical protein